MLSARSVYVKSLTWRNNSGFSRKKVQWSVPRSAHDQKLTKFRRNLLEEEFMKVGEGEGRRSIQEEPNYFRPLDLGKVHDI
jgi:hypothetical protein